jgi:sirohydrochlorin cobaltochelatase
MSSFRDAALVLAGHGSTVNADSSAPTYLHADEIRRRGLFAEVRECFWKEEPNFRWVLAEVESARVYVVPDFISSGYFTEEVIPRELGLSGPAGSVTWKDGKEIYYCEPVGLHPSMTEALLHRAREVAAADAPDPRQTALFVIGHGTGLNENSTKVIHDQVARIRQRGVYAECHATFMEQEPFIRDWRTITAKPNVIAVPFFIADGLHSYEDIPVLLGMTANVKANGFRNPHEIGGRRLWYASAIGTDAAIADVIVAQVEKFDASRAAA